MNNHKAASRYFTIVPGRIVKIAILLFAIFASSSAKINAQQSAVASVKTMKEDGIKFTEGSWSNALKQAAKEHKYIFVDAYASWCGPCKQLKATTFRDEAAAMYFNEHFVNLSFDVEKGEGPKLATRWKIQGLPTLLVFDEHGKQLTRAVGYIGANDLIDFGKEAMSKK